METDNVFLHGKREFAGMIKAQDLKLGRLSWIMEVDLILQFINSGKPFWAVVTEKEVTTGGGSERSNISSFADRRKGCGRGS